MGLRRRLLHRQIAEQSEQAADPDSDRLAYHYEQAADERAINWWIHAAERARLAYAWRAAAERLAAAVRCQDQLGVRVAPQQLLLFESAVRIRCADPNTALNRLNRAILEAEREDDRAVAAVARTERGFVRWHLGHYREGIAEIAHAVRECDRLEEEDPGVFDRADARLSSFGPRGGLRRVIAARRSVVMASSALVGHLAEVLDTGEPLRDAVLQVDVDDTTMLGGAITTGPHAPFGGKYQIGNTALGLAELYTLLGHTKDAEMFAEITARSYQAQGNHYLVWLSAANTLLTLTLPLQAERIDRRRHVQQLIRDTGSRAQDIGPTTRSPLAADFAVPLIEGDWDAARACYRLARSNLTRSNTNSSDPGPRCPGSLSGRSRGRSGAGGGAPARGMADRSWGLRLCQRPDVATNRSPHRA